MMYDEDDEHPVKETIIMPSGAVFDKAVGIRILEARVAAIKERNAEIEAELAGMGEPAHEATEPSHAEG